MEIEGFEVKKRFWGIPNQGEKTPSTTMRDNRERRIVGLKIEMGFFELVEEEDEIGNGFEKGLWRLL